MRGQGESGRHAPGAREARDEKDEQERTRRGVERGSLVSSSFARSLKGSTRALHSRD